MLIAASEMVLTPHSQSDGQLDRPVHAATFALIIVVKEVAIQACLNDAGHPDDPLKIVVFSEVTKDPIEQVKPTVSAKCCHIMRRQVFHFSLLLQQE